MYFVQLRIAPQNPKTPNLILQSLIIIIMKSILVSSLISTIAVSRKHLVDNNEEKIKVESPNVDDCLAKCLFENDSNSWCF